jgi:hypothetical protein
MLALILPSLTEAKPKLQFGFHLKMLQDISGQDETEIGLYPIACNLPADDVSNEGNVWVYLSMENGQFLPQSVRTASAPSSLANRLKPESKRIRSAVTNGERPFVLGNGCSPWARRQRDLIALHIADLGGEASIRKPAQPMPPGGNS